MATVQFTNGYSWDNLPKAEIRRLIPLATVLSRLAQFRADWQEIAEADGLTLAEVKVEVGFLLADICTMLELNPEETAHVLGSELAEVVK